MVPNPQEVLHHWVISGGGRPEVGRGWMDFPLLRRWGKGIEWGHGRSAGGDADTMYFSLEIPTNRLGSHFNFFLALRSYVQSGSYFSFLSRKRQRHPHIFPSNISLCYSGHRENSTSPQRLFYKKRCFCFFLFIAVIGEIKLSSPSNLLLLYSYRQYLFLRIAESPDVAKIFAA